MKCFANRFIRQDRNKSGSPIDDRCALKIQLQLELGLQLASAGELKFNFGSKAEFTGWISLAQKWAATSWKSRSRFVSILLSKTLLTVGFPLELTNAKLKSTPCLTDTFYMTGLPSQYRLLTNAIEFASQNHRVISQNVANVNTPEYKARTISFDAILESSGEKRVG